MNSTIQSFFYTSSFLFRSQQSLDKQIERIKKEQAILIGFREDINLSLNAEYGASDDSSYGAKLYYFAEPSIKSHNRSHSKEIYEMDIYYKYKILSNDRWILTIKPSMNKRFSSDLRGGLSIIWGYAKNKNKIGAKLFQEIEIGLGAEVWPTIGNRSVYNISLLDGISLDNGLGASHFIQYSFCKNENILYNRILYEQLSIDKSFKINNYKLSEFTISLGYFRKISLSSKAVKMSGPVLSTWFNL